MRALTVVGCCLLIGGTARADDRDGNGVDDDLYVIPHPATKWWLSGQVNVVSQAQPGFHSTYEGANSLQPGDHRETSFVATVYAAYEITPYTAVMIAGESPASSAWSSPSTTSATSSATSPWANRFLSR